MSAVVSAWSREFMQENLNSTQGAATRIHWDKRRGITKYRLQIAADSQFTDIRFDGLVEGYQFDVDNLGPGHYYWRIAEAQNGTGAFLNPVTFEVKAIAPVVRSTLPPVRTPATSSSSPETKIVARVAAPGWSVATGEVVQLMSMQLRRGTSPDFLGVNSEGTVYALDGTRGIALWTAHFKLGSSGDERVRFHYNQFSPLLINSAPTPRVVVAFDKGIRELDGSTGRELWNTKIAGRAKSGVVVTAQNTKPELYLIGEQADKMFVLDADTGQLKSQLTLRGDALGPPILLANGDDRQILIPLKGGLIELRDTNGDYVRSIKVGADITTQPIIVRTPRGPILLVGLKNGLGAFDTAWFQPLGRIAIDKEEYPVDSRAVADLNGDNTSEVVLTTNTGRVMAIDVINEKITWSTPVGYEVTSPSFADLNADGHLDVILPGKDDFAIALSGVDGSLIWRSGEQVTDGIKTSMRSLAVAIVSAGRLILVGNDRSAAGLRALEVNRLARSSPE